MAKQTHTYTLGGKAWKIFTYPDQVHVHPANERIKEIARRMRLENGTLNWPRVKEELDRAMGAATEIGQETSSKQGPFNSYWQAAEFAKSAARSLACNVAIESDEGFWYVTPVDSDRA